MNHESASGKLLELVYGELTPREARAVEAHAAGCAACRAELAAFRETRALMSLLPPEPPPERGEGIVLAAAREAAAARRARPLLPRWLVAGTAGAMAIALVAVVSWQLVRAPPAGPLADTESDLLGRAPQAVAAPPPATTGDLAPEKGLAAAPPRAITEPAPGGRATATRRAPPPPAALQREQLRERMADSDAGGWTPTGGGEGAIAQGGASVAPVAPAPPAARAAPRAAAPAAAAAAMDEAERLADAPSAPAAAPAPPPAPRGRSEVEPATKAAKAPAFAERKAAGGGGAESRAELAPGSVESRAFAGCPGEVRRVVERDDEGRVVRYVRQGERVTVEQRYGPDGRLVAAAAIEGGVRRVLPLDAPGLVRLARDAGIDAPPRCAP